jgi:hypothetical protein
MRPVLRPKSNWLAAVELGLVSSTFSTIVSQLAAARLGRDAFVDWMTRLASIPTPGQRTLFLASDRAGTAKPASRVVSHKPGHRGVRVTAGQHGIRNGSAFMTLTNR